MDPRGLVTPFVDKWSLDGWVVDTKGQGLLPSYLSSVEQCYATHPEARVTTRSSLHDMTLEASACVHGSPEAPVCRLEYRASCPRQAWFVISLRPSNPEGVSFVQDIENYRDGNGWVVNGAHKVLFSSRPQRRVFSEYNEGDVFHHILEPDLRERIQCRAGMATAAALFLISPGKETAVTCEIPLLAKRKFRGIRKRRPVAVFPDAETGDTPAGLRIPDAHYTFLYRSALSTMILHSPKEVFAGPYTYKRFWFRDAALIAHVMASTGLTIRARKITREFFSRQKATGYFESQYGEWDSNGQVLWCILQCALFSGSEVPRTWRRALERSARWIERKRLPETLPGTHAGLMPAGFSAEHLGPNDYYYWDDFWSIAGLRAGGEIMERWGDEESARHFRDTAERLLKCTTLSLHKVKERIHDTCMPASPYRRMDSGAIGSLVAGYPLRIYKEDDSRLLATADYLIHHHLVDDGFFHDMTHSGINPYLTLHIAQILLRAGDGRYRRLMEGIARLSSSTGQWPEAIHPMTKGGCMGDGQHVWAAAEWAMMVRNCFVREEESAQTLVLLSGVLPRWYERDREIMMGPVPTLFGPLTVRAIWRGEVIDVSWEARWHGKAPRLLIGAPDGSLHRVADGRDTDSIPWRGEQ